MWCIRVKLHLKRHLGDLVSGRLRFKFKDAVIRFTNVLFLFRSNLYNQQRDAESELG